MTYHALLSVQYHVQERKFLWKILMCMLNVEISPTVEMLLQVYTQCVSEATSEYQNCNVSSEGCIPPDLTR